MLFCPVLLQFHKVLLLNSPPGNPRLPRLPRSLLYLPIFLFYAFFFLFFQLPSSRCCFWPPCFGSGVEERREYSILQSLVIKTPINIPTHTRIVFFSRHGLGFYPCCPPPLSLPPTPQWWSGISTAGRVPEGPGGASQSALVPFGEICFLKGLVKVSLRTTWLACCLSTGGRPIRHHQKPGNWHLTRPSRRG
jgi:hypothetical protein